MRGWKFASKTMRPKASPTRTSSWRRRSRTWSTGNRARREDRSRARRRRISASPISSTTSSCAPARPAGTGQAQMGHAWIDGRPVALHAALSEAARLLEACRAPVVAGLGTDIAGARAAIALAQRLGAAVDHMHSEAVLRDLAVMRGAGMMVTTPNVARLTADVVLLIGAGLLDLPERLLAPSASSPGEEGSVRRIIRLCPGR